MIDMSQIFTTHRPVLCEICKGKTVIIAGYPQCKNCGYKDDSL